MMSDIQSAMKNRTGELEKQNSDLEERLEAAGEATHMRETMTFTNPTPKVSLVNTGSGRTRWRLNDGYFYHWQHGGNWYRFKIDKGFVSDGASVPWFLPWGRGRLGVLAPLVHDWLHHVAGWVDVELLEDNEWVECGFMVRWSRRDADRLFFRIFRETGVEPRWLRRGAFRAVRAWSWINGDEWK